MLQDNGVELVEAKSYNSTNNLNIQETTSFSSTRGSFDSAAMIEQDRRLDSGFQPNDERESYLRRSSIYDRDYGRNRNVGYRYYVGSNLRMTSTKIPKYPERRIFLNQVRSNFLDFSFFFPFFWFELVLL